MNTEATTTTEATITTDQGAQDPAQISRRRFLMRLMVGLGGLGATAVGLRARRILLTAGPIPVHVRDPFSIARGASSAAALVGRPVGVALGTIARLLCYRFLVFRTPAGDSPNAPLPDPVH